MTYLQSVEFLVTGHHNRMAGRAVCGEGEDSREDLDQPLEGVARDSLQ